MTIFDRHVDGHLAGGMHLQDATDDNPNTSSHKMSGLRSPALASETRQDGTEWGSPNS
jgi:hypothetical protein